MLSDDADSTSPRMWSMRVPSEPSFFLAVAVTRGASWPPCGNLTFLSCKEHLLLQSSLSAPFNSSFSVMSQEHQEKSQRRAYCSLWENEKILEADLYQGQCVICQLLSALIVSQPDLRRAHCVLIASRNGHTSRQSPKTNKCNGLDSALIWNIRRELAW